MKLVTFNDIFTKEPKTPSIVLVEGAAGTLKSALCFSLMIDSLKDDEEACGLYLTFEQNWTSHLQNMESLGFKHPENLLHSDYNIMRKQFGNEEIDIKIFDSIMSILEAIYSEKKDKFKIFTLDSLNALYSIMPKEYLESATASFFNRLRELDIVSLLIYEKSLTLPQTTNRERFLADGIISLGIMHGKGDVVRYLQPLKLASSEHSLKKRHLHASKDGIALLGSVYR